MSAIVIWTVQSSIWGALLWSTPFLGGILYPRPMGEEPAESTARLPDYLSDLA